jgi:hypothetical protein
MALFGEKPQSLIEPNYKTETPTGMDPQQKVIIQQTPIGLKEIVYQDAKSMAKKVYKVAAIILIIALVYYTLGAWGIVAFFGFLPIALALIPKIAEKFHTYINVASFELNEKEPDKLRVLRIPYKRFEKALLLDSNGDKAGLSAPFNSTLGLTYIADKVELAQPVPGMPPSIQIDVITLHNIHNNMEFTNNYVPEFLKLRREWLVIKKENFGWKSLFKINTMKEYIRKVELFQKLADKMIFEGIHDDAETVKAYNDKLFELEQLQHEIGISNKTPFQEIAPTIAEQLQTGKANREDITLVK